MASAILSLVLLVIAVAAVVYWIVCLVNWDGEMNCDESQCDSCPFPCEKHDQK